MDLERGRDARAALARRARKRLGVRARLAPTGRRVRHTITHRDIVVEVWRGSAPAANRAPGLAWIDARRPSVALTALARKAIDALGDGVSPTQGRGGGGR